MSLPIIIGGYAAILAAKRAREEAERKRKAAEREARSRKPNRPFDPFHSAHYGGRRRPLPVPVVVPRHGYGNDVVPNRPVRPRVIPVPNKTVSTTDSRSRYAGKRRRVSRRRPASKNLRLYRGINNPVFRKKSGVRISSGKLGSILVRNREYVCDVASTTTVFEINDQFILNPGNVRTFPWLHRIAQNFETYKFNRLRFVYEPACSTATNGAVCMAVDYDCSDVAPISWGDMTNYNGSTHGSPFVPHRMSCYRNDMYKKIPWKHVSNSTAIGKVDRTDHFGIFYLGNDLAALAQNLGKVYVEYSVELVTPQKNAPIYGAAIWGNLTAGGLHDSPAGQSGSIPVKWLASGQMEFIRDFQGICTFSVDDAVGGAIAGSSVAVAGGSRYAYFLDQLGHAYSIVNAATDHVLACVKVIGGVGSTIGFTATGGTVTGTYILRFFDADTKADVYPSLA